MKVRVGIDDIISLLQQNWLCWYGHIWVKKCMEYEVEGSRPRGRPKRTWKEVVQKDCQLRKLNMEGAMDHSRRRKLIKDGWFFMPHSFTQAPISCVLQCFALCQTPLKTGCCKEGSGHLLWFFALTRYYAIIVAEPVWKFAQFIWWWKGFI